MDLKANNNWEKTLRIWNLVLLRELCVLVIMWSLGSSPDEAGRSVFSYPFIFGDEEPEVREGK